jgi:hypothetical protein
LVLSLLVLAVYLLSQASSSYLILRSSTDNKGRSSSVYYPVVKFTPNNGEATTFESNSGSKPPAFRKGQQVEVLYDPQQPDSAMINSWLELWFLPGMFTGMGSLFVLIGGVPLVKSLSYMITANRK